MDFYIKYKLIKVRHELIDERIRIFLGLGLIKGIQYITLSLRKIEIQKMMFVLELEQGKEVPIPKSLQQHDLP
jgi:hypothetical protein